MKKIGEIAFLELEWVTCEDTCIMRNEVCNSLTTHFDRVRGACTVVSDDKPALLHAVCKKPKKAIFPLFFHDFFAVFPYIWPLAGPNIAEKGAAIVGKAWERVWEGFGKS